jgi:FdhE protein
VLQREHPEWNPWLAPLEVTLVAAQDPAWASTVPVLEQTSTSGSPVLDGARLVVDGALLGRLIRALARRAAAAGSTTAPGGAADLLHGERSLAANGALLLQAAVTFDREGLAGLPARASVSVASVEALAPLVALPVLQACGGAARQHLPDRWTGGFCPVCGAWPALAEARGLERERRLRCGRCGTDWWSDWLRCPFCDNRDHLTLGPLVPAAGGESRRLETCARCRGYVKTLSTLGAASASEIAVIDLATIDLDVTALARGYRRPEEPGHVIDVSVEPRRGVVRRLLDWAA